MNADFLLEIGCEDLPARYVVPLARALGEGVSKGFGSRGIAHSSDTRVFATPRRIAVLIREVCTRQDDQLIERSGPSMKAALKDGEPTKAALGFARSCGVEFAELEERNGKLFFTKSEPGRDTTELIPEIFEDSLKQMDNLVPKRMRWGSGEETFVRPVAWICCLLGAEIVPLERFGVSAGRQTYGHRFHAPDALNLSVPAEYQDRLKDAKVWADFDSRRQEISRQISVESDKLGGTARVSDDLLDEVTALVEWPVAITGHFDEPFLKLPPEVIVATVETNQRYFTVFEDAEQTRLTNAFITVSNIESRDVSQVISGNERVVRPRLSDALFFWEQDLKQPLSDYTGKLTKVTFQKSLGSVAEKLERVGSLAASISEILGDDPGPVSRAAALCKADLVTRMVFEFPELQGIVGGYYAASSGEPAEVCEAIRDHYLPTQQGTPIPAGRTGQVLALADKLDTLAGIFSIGQKPTASKDPYALRRAALGVLRICIEAGLPLDLETLLPLAVAQQPGGKNEAVVEEVLAFINERLRAYLTGQEIDGRAITVETVEAVRTLGIHQPFDAVARVHAVHRFLTHDAAPHLAAANKRIRNLLRQSEVADEDIVPARFEHDAERELHQAIQAIAEKNLETAEYADKLVNLAGLRTPVDAFFDAVMVNADDPEVKRNRLALLKELNGMCQEVADLSCLPG